MRFIYNVQNKREHTKRGEAGKNEIEQQQTRNRHNKKQKQEFRFKKMRLKGAAKKRTANLYV